MVPVVFRVFEVGGRVVLSVCGLEMGESVFAYVCVLECVLDYKMGVLARELPGELCFVLITHLEALVAIFFVWCLVLVGGAGV